MVEVQDQLLVPRFLGQEEVAISSALVPEHLGDRMVLQVPFPSAVGVAAENLFLHNIN